MTGFLADLAQAVRRLSGTPGFTAATIASISLAIGVNVAVFTTANDLLIKPMAVPRSGELVRIYRNRHSPLTGQMLSAVQQSRSFSDVFGEANYGAAMSIDRSEPEAVRVSLASDNLFQGLQVIPAAGRLFTREGDEGGAVIVLSWEFWARRFGRDPSIVGRAIRLNDRPFTIIGVAPEGRASAQLGWWSDLIVPTRDARALTGVPADSIQGSFYVTARLAPGVDAAQANAELRVLAAQFLQADTAMRNLQLRTRPARGVTEELRLPVTAVTGFLAAIAALVLVMAATNVGNLMLARNAARRRELGVRTALGASRARLVRLLLAESVVLAVVAGIAAWVIAAWSVAWLPAILPSDIEVRFTFAADWRVFVATALVTLVAVALFGWIPARVALRRSVAEAIKEGSAIGHGVEGARIRRRFLSAQVALCALLLTTGSLFVRSLGRASTIDLGFRPEGIVTAWFDVRGRQLPAEQRAAFFDRVLEEVRQLPVVSDATWSETVELTGSNSETRVVTDLMPDTANGHQTYFNRVGASYHQTLGIPLLSGRDFARTDNFQSPPVAIVNETFAAREWPGQDPLGRRVSFNGPEGPWHEVIGVARNVKYHSLGEGPKAFLTIPHSQVPATSLVLEARVRPGADATEAMAAIVRVARAVDPLLPPPRTRPIGELQALALLPARAGAALLGGIGVLAFLLAAVGVGGVAAFTVAQRTREIGVRTALGAPPAALLRGVLGDTWRTVAWGAGAGLVAAVGVGQLISSQLYGVSPVDPVTFALVPLLLVLLAAIAAFVPARRALSIPPTEALRAE